MPLATILGNASKNCTKPAAFSGATVEFLQCFLMRQPVVMHALTPRHEILEFRFGTTGGQLVQSGPDT